MLFLTVSWWTRPVPMEQLKISSLANGLLGLMATTHRGGMRERRAPLGVDGRSGVYSFSDDSWFERSRRVGAS